MKMKVFVATKEKQGVRNNDFNFTNEGELVKLGFECDGESVDGECGCKRGVCGIDTHKATTTFTIEDRDNTEKEYIELMLESEKKAGWINKDTDKETLKEFEDSAKYLLELACGFNVGDILERRGAKIQVR